MPAKQVLIIIFLGAIAYSGSFFNSFHFDDLTSIINNPAIRNICNTNSIWNFWPTRFITYLSIALNYRLCNLNVFGYHLFNFAVHLACAIAVWRLVLLVLGTPLMKKDTLRPRAGLVAFFTSVIFLLHPVQTQPLNYIIQRAALIAAFFYITSVALYIKARLKSAEEPLSQACKVYYAGSMLSAVMSMFSKEMSVSLPFVICLCEFYFFKAKRNFNWKYIGIFFIIALIVPLTVVMTKSVNFEEMSALDETGARVCAGHYFLTQLRVMATYLRLAFLPMNQNIDYDYPIAKTIFAMPVILSLLLVILILLAGLKISGRYKLAAFGIFWFFITLLPESSIIPIKDVIFEHRLYLPMAGFSLFLVSSLYYLFGKKRIRIAAAALSLLTVVFLTVTYQRNRVWESEITLWNDAVHKSPNKARPYNNRGVAYANNGGLNLALADFNRAIEINPGYAYAYNNRGNVYVKKGNIDRALTDFNAAIRIIPNHACVYNNRALFYIQKGDIEKALADFNKAIEIGRYYYADPYNNRGLVYFRRGDIDRAVADFNKAIEINPGNSYAYNNRGNAYFNKGDYNKAILDGTKAIKINPNDGGFYYNRAMYYYRTGDYNRAGKDMRRAHLLGYKIDP